MPLVRRRTVLAGALGGIATTLLVGCDTGEDLDPPGPAGSAAPSPSTASGTPEPARSPDETLVDEVAAGLSTALVTAVRARKARGLRPVLAPLVRAHRAHLEVLEGDLPPSDPGPPPAPAVAVREVRQAEQRLQALLVEASTQAESGALAKLLASMSASVTQHLAVLPRNA